MRYGCFEEITVELPGGLISQDEGRIDSVQVRPLTGREEDWLAWHAGIPNSFAVTELLSECVLGAGQRPCGKEIIRQFSVGDRDFLILQVRRITLGENVQAVVECTGCSAKVDVDFLASQVPVESRRQTALTYTVELAGGHKVDFRILNGADQEAVAWMSTAEAVPVLLQRCLVSGQLVAQEDHEMIISAIEAHSPRVDLELDVHCPECGHGFLVPFDTTAFFLQELRVRQDQLLREVHALAINYHWSEREILGMVHAKRRAYLEVLSAAVGAR